MTRDAMLQTIRDLVDLAPRMTGTPGGAATADYVERRFREAGLETETLRVPSYSWRGTAALSAGGVEMPCSPVQHSALPAHDWTGEASHDVAARVVDIGVGKVRDHDVRGAIVLFDLTFDMKLAHLLPFAVAIHDPDRRMLRRESLQSRNPYITSLSRVMTAAAEGGAAGVIGVLRDYPESLEYHNEYYRRTLFRLPGVWVTAAGGRALRESIARDPQAALRLDVERARVESTTVLGVLPGRTRETIMVQSHHDSIGPGAVEDASGTAELVALADHFGAEHRAGRVREKTLLFASFDSHFTGYQAHMAFAERHVLASDRPYDIVLNATVEHIGLRAVRGADGGFETLPETEPRGIFCSTSAAFGIRIARAMRRHRLASTALLNASPLQFGAGGIPTDASFTFVCGVPTVSLISGPLYLYDAADTVDRIDAEQLEPVARFFVDVIDEAERRRGTRLGSAVTALRRRRPPRGW